MAGGGGMISVPALLSTGLPPQIALATNKLQSSFGSITSSSNYVRHGLVKVSDCKWGILFALIGAVCGSTTLLYVPADFLKKLIPIVLAVVFCMFLFFPKFGLQDIAPRMKKPMFYLVFGLLIGFYDGFIGPGTGAFWSLAFVSVLGLNLKRATAHTKIVNFTSNIVSLSVFILSGRVLWLLVSPWPVGRC